MLNQQALESAMKLIVQTVQLLKLNNRFFPLAILALLFLLIKGNRKERLFALSQVLAAVFLVCNPVIANYWVRKIPFLEFEYYHVFAILMMNLIIGLAVLKLIQNLATNQQIFAVFGTLWIMLLLSGVLPNRCVDIETNQSTKNQQQIYRNVIESVEGTLDKDEAVSKQQCTSIIMLAPYEITSASRIYSNQINVLYNKDMTQVQPKTEQDLYTQEIDDLCEQMWSEEPDYSYLIPTAAKLNCSHIVLLKERVNSQAITQLKEADYEEVDVIDAYVIYQRKRTS